MIKIAICDDEKIVAHQMENDILMICQKENISIETEVFYSGQELGDKIDRGERYDIIYLDIQMDQEDGISAAKRIRSVDENVLLIFVSGYDKYVMELFRLNAFDFLKKPWAEPKFKKTLLDACKKVCDMNAFYFMFRYKGIEYKVLNKEILYFESKARLIHIHIQDGKVEKFNMKLSEVEERLNKGKIPFLRIHQSYLVNYYQIRSRTKTEVTLTNDEKLPISEDRKKSFNFEYGKLLGGEVDG